MLTFLPEVAGYEVQELLTLLVGVGGGRSAPPPVYR